jgi:hypothetical protein
MKKLPIVFLMILSYGVVAREVDNYMAWGVDLDDSGPAIDEYIRAHLSDAIHEVNAGKYDLPPAGAGSIIEEEVAGWYDNCYDAAYRLMRHAFYNPTYQLIEKYIDEGNGLDIYPRHPSTDDEALRLERGETPDNGFMTDDEYLDASIVQTSPMNVPLSRIVNVYGVYSGADKFGHFTSFGVRYLARFDELLEKGMDPEDAFNEVMEFGYKSERSVVGMMFTKVFSRGDLEANFQGMRFAWSLCQDDSEVKLKFDGDNWELKNVEAFTIKDYANPLWDESFFNPIYTEEKWNESVVPTFERRDDCAKLGSAWVREQREFYLRNVEHSANTRYGGNWIPENFKGVSTRGFSLNAYCDIPIELPRDR